MSTQQENFAAAKQTTEISPL